MRAILLAILLVALPASVGCVVMTVHEPLIPAPPEGDASARTFEYTQTLKGDITEAERIEAVIQTYGDRLEADEQNRSTQTQKLD